MRDTLELHPMWAAICIVGTVLSAAPRLQAAEDSVRFTANAGQWDDSVRFQSSTGPMTTWFTDTGWIFTLESHPSEARSRGVAVRMTFADLSEDVSVLGERVTVAKQNYFHGTRAVVGVPVYERVRYVGLYPGVDMLVRGNGGHLEYDLVLAPGADVSRLAIRIEGSDGYSVQDDGTLVLQSALGSVVSPAPRTWSESADGTRHAVDCRYRRIDDQTFGFEVEDHDASRRLVIDPELIWATYLGSSSFDMVRAVVHDEATNTVVVTGYTANTGFPTTPGAYDPTHNGSRDVFVTRISSDGSELLFSTHLGGSSGEEAWGLELGTDGSILVTGFTGSTNFPTTSGAFDTSHAGGGALLGSDVFVTQLESDGSALRFSTLLGGAQDETGVAVGFDIHGGIYVAGRTASPDFPVTPGAVDTIHGGGTPNVGDVFVARLDKTGSDLTWGTFLGGAQDDNVNAMSVNAAGEVALVGWTLSSDYPTTPRAFDTQMTGSSEGFVTRMSGNGQRLLLSTFIGGAGDDNATAVHIDGNGRLIVAGTTLSADLPTTGNAHDDDLAGGVFHGDGFVVCLDASGEHLEYGTYLGGALDDFPTAIATNHDGTIVVSGWTQSGDFDTTSDAHDDSLDGDSDAFVTQIDTDLGVVYSTFLGGGSDDKAMTMSLSRTGVVTLAGTTSSGAFPVTTGSYDEDFGGIEGFVTDAFVACLHFGSGLASSGGVFEDMGFAMAGTNGLTPHIMWNGSLQPGTTGTVDVIDVRPNTLGLIVMGYSPELINFHGGTMVPYPLAIVLVLVTDASGFVSVPYGWPLSAPPELVMYVQAFFQDTAGPDGYSASNAVYAVSPP